MYRYWVNISLIVYTRVIEDFPLATSFIGANIFTSVRIEDYELVSTMQAEATAECIHQTVVVR